ncbi:hypothetical protein B0T11DRAFT_292930 [Plectosphaerella cucumerina]|uniref:DUF7907 domain-containing protein n=1 Tax=Plectosphaerella cucumerina TaxID=40658 RepID=A0A8K0TUT9_9PEZI|nr:hypothetical protein B0T11DRAFT_292930 [Plectosphaerella cucumerina]
MHSAMNIILAGSLAGLAIAGTTTTINQNLDKSAGFELVAVVTNPATDLTPSINFWTLSTIHDGAGRAVAGLSNDAASVWYLNGTENQIKDYESSLLTDAGTPPFPNGLDFVYTPSGTADLRVDAGPGTPGVGLNQNRDLFYLSAPGNDGTYMACRESIPYYSGKEFIVLKYAYHGVPQGCAEIRLVPQCAELAPLPPNALASHEYAMPVPCHVSVEAWETSA